MKVCNLSQAATDARKFDSGDSSPYRSPLLSPVKDTHSSLGQTIAYGVFTCFAYVVIKVFSFITSSLLSKSEGTSPVRGAQRKKELERTSKGDLKDPKNLRDYFLSDPYSVIDTILDLVDTAPDQAEAILVKLAREWKENAQEYSPYSPNASCRRNWVNNFDGMMIKLLLTPEQQQVNDRIVELEIEEDEASALSDSDAVWAGRKNKSGQAAKMREIHKTNEKIKKEFREHLWGFCYGKILKDEDKFSDLTYYRDPHHSSKEDGSATEITFGGFLEALMYNRKANNLLASRIFNEWSGYLAEFLREVMSNRSGRAFVIEKFPRIKQLIEKMQGILSDDEKTARLQRIISKVIGIFHPSGKSPKKSDSPVH